MKEAPPPPDCSDSDQVVTTVNVPVNAHGDSVRQSLSLLSKCSCSEWKLQPFHLGAIKTAAFMVAVISAYLSVK